MIRDSADRLKTDPARNLATFTKTRQKRWQFVQRLRFSLLQFPKSQFSILGFPCNI
ncbi:hypothetical protein LSG31_03265 [Fodinisporobacter ferrooxydans]|uniref:Uncharacterized protein n=1 Tax=Fodinisporobacter ferrooxydans TaxID=2901836 RepID=A0ABY4CLA9_9BACL|nr:hypothetical protein LSG31_03265 [Alicyclobacillaceae bacterium MYW30-H2]